VQTHDLYRVGEALAETVIERHRRRLRKCCRRITLEFTFFHGYYDTYCYRPLLGTMTSNDEAEQYLICALLGPGNAKASKGLGLSESIIHRPFG